MLTFSREYTEIVSTVDVHAMSAKTETCAGAKAQVAIQSIASCMLKGLLRLGYVPTNPTYSTFGLTKLVAV